MLMYLCIDENVGPEKHPGLLIAHGVQQRPHESFYPGSTSKQKL